MLDATHWSDIQAVNGVLGVLCPALDAVGVTRGERIALQEYWTFPMHSLEMTKVDVTPDERKREQEAWVANQYGY